MKPSGRGELKVYLGYAAGVGKTYKMLEDAQALRAEGVDITVGYFEPHGRPDTIAKLEGLEVAPRRTIEYRGARFEEMDTGAILARHPAVCVVDEYPHTNVPGCERQKRWQDVEALLDAGIDVLTTMNIQHLESLNDQVRHLTGVHVRETVPDWAVQQAAEVVMVDVTPRALLNRLERGVIYGREKAGRALENFFQESTLVALRELAMRQTAHEVEHRAAGLKPGTTLKPGVATVHRILAVVTADPESAMVIRRAKRVGDFLGAECFAIVVDRTGDLATLPAQRREAIEQHLNFARNLHLEARVLAGGNAAETLVEFARRNQVTQIFVTRESGGLVRKIVSLARDMQVVIVSGRQR